MNGADRAVAGSGLFAAALGFIPLIVGLIPKLETVGYIKDALELYNHYLRNPLMKVLGVPNDYNALGGLVFDLIVVWIATFAAVHAFIHAKDGVSVWRHIQINSCYLVDQRFISLNLCTLPKYLVAFGLAPIVCVASVFASLRTGRQYFSMGYLTINPRIVAKYLMIGTALAAATILVFGYAFEHLGPH